MNIGPQLLRASHCKFLVEQLRWGCRCRSRLCGRGSPFVPVGGQGAKEGLPSLPKDCLSTGCARQRVHACALVRGHVYVCARVWVLVWVCARALTCTCACRHVYCCKHVLQNLGRASLLPAKGAAGETRQGF